MVVTPHPLATAAGVEALRAGGTAVDAAVAANAMLAVVYCGSCGIGGDAFALVWEPGEGRLHGFNGSGRSPAALTIEAVRQAGHDEMPARGPLAITVPGAVDAWVQLLERFGRRSLADALLPAAATAESGYALTAITAGSIAASMTFFDDDARAVFGSAGGPGDAFRQPMLAGSLRAIADGGRDAYYGGPIGAEIARAIRDAGGVMTADDIAGHRGDWVEPITTTYRDIEVATIPPNSQGITALIALNVLSMLDWPMGAPLSAERLHAQLESVKVAWSERDRCVADPDRGLADPCSCCQPSTLRGWRPASHPIGHSGSRRRIRRLGHGLPCTADGDGMMVSLIESNYMGFGSGVMGGSTGITLQNRGAYFSLDPEHPNALAPRSRTLHTLMPGCSCATAGRGRHRRDGRRRPAADDGAAGAGPRGRRPRSAGGGRPAAVRRQDRGCRPAARPGQLRIGRR